MCNACRKLNGALEQHFYVDMAHHNLNGLQSLCLPQKEIRCQKMPI